MVIKGAPQQVFAFMDNIENTGKHMTKNNAAMMGSKLNMQWLSEHHTGVGTKYRWTGKTLGLKMDFTVEVSQWRQDEYKEWGTIGEARMVVISWFAMNLHLSPWPDGNTCATLGIHYTKANRLPGRLFGRAYSKWCVNSMLRDTRKHFKKLQAGRDKLAKAEAKKAL